MNGLGKVIRSSPRRLVALAGVLLAAGALQVTGANPAVSQTATLTAWHSDDDLDLDPTAGEWGRAAAVEVPLTSQAVVYPKGGDVPMVRARAIHSNRALYVHLEWEDGSLDDSTAAVENFADAIAVEFPAEATSSVPAVCMGQADAAVNIWHWRADTEPGIPDVITDVSPGGYVDSYPSTDDLYYPAREAENPYALARSTPIQNLVAGGFGTLEPTGQQVVHGAGHHDDGTWKVVFARELEAPGELQPSFASGDEIDIAFAVWNGEDGDRNGKKSVSQFVKLAISAESLPGPGGVQLPLAVKVLLIAGVGGAILAAAFKDRLSRAEKR